MGHLLLAGYIAAFAADATTTSIAFNRGGREVVMPTQNALVIDAVVAGEAAAGWWAYQRVNAHHPKASKVLYVGLVFAHGAAATWNARQLAK